MDIQIANLIRTAETAIKPVQRWRVKNEKGALTRRTLGDSAANYPFNSTFFESYRVSLWKGFSWIKDRDQPRFVRELDCEKIDSTIPPPQPPPDNADMKWVLSDYELLGTPFERKRPDISGQPQTVKMSCLKYDTVPASNDYIRITRELNGGISFEVLAGIMDSWTPKGAKWGAGEFKVPSIIFASNPVGVVASMRNPGGLTGIKGGEWIWEIDTLNYDALENYTADTVPSRYIMHLTVSRNGSYVVNPSPALGAREGNPVKLLITSKSVMYLRSGFLASIGNRTNRYSPPWEKGVIS